jgi:flagellar basal-body rod modification protein FlgD
VYEATGRLARTLRFCHTPAGNLPFAWDGRDETGAKLPSGTYFVRASADGHTVTRRVTLLR